MDAPTNHLQTESGRKLQETLDRAAKGIREPRAARLAALERLDKHREEMGQRGGIVDVVVPILCELRD